MKNVETEVPIPKFRTINGNQVVIFVAALLLTTRHVAHLITTEEVNFHVSNLMNMLHYLSHFHMSKSYYSTKVHGQKVTKAKSSSLILLMTPSTLSVTTLHSSYRNSCFFSGYNVMEAYMTYG
jgi:hypothetical protein